MAAHEDFSRTHSVTASSNRGFGWVFTVAFVIIGVWPLLFGRELRAWSLSLAGVFLIATIMSPALLALPNRLWQRFGLLLSRIVSPIMLALLFFIVVAPLGCLMRLLGKSPLQLHRSGGAGSYWIKRDPPGPSPDSLANQF